MRLYASTTQEIDWKMKNDTPAGIAKALMLNASVPARTAARDAKRPEHLNNASTAKSMMTDNAARHFLALSVLPSDERNLQACQSSRATDARSRT